MSDRIIASLVVLACAAPSPAAAWGRDGHRAVCLVAWEQLTDGAKARVSELLAVSTDMAFAETCVWADEIAKTRPETAAWHGIALPKDARAFELRGGAGRAARRGPDKRRAQAGAR